MAVPQAPLLDSETVAGSLWPDASGTFTALTHYAAQGPEAA